MRAGDFDIYEHIDLIVSQFDKLDFLLHNEGDRTFSLRSADFVRLSAFLGSMATAVDFNQDYHLDAVLSELDWPHN